MISGFNSFVENVKHLRLNRLNLPFSPFHLYFDVTEKTRKNVHRTRMPPPKYHSEKEFIYNCNRYSMKLLSR